MEDGELISTANACCRRGLMFGRIALILDDAGPTVGDRNPADEDGGAVCPDARGVIDNATREAVRSSRFSPPRLLAVGDEIPT